MAGLNKDGSRSVFIAAVLVVSLVATAVLAWQAHMAVSSHRRAAAEVLSDYSALAADEFIRNASRSLGYDGLYPVTRALSRALDTAPTLAAAVAAIPSESDDGGAAALMLARSYFLARYDGIVVSTEGEPPSWLVTELSALNVIDTPFAVRHVLAGGEPHMLVVVEHEDAVSGFEVDLEALSTLFGPLLERALLPASLGRGGITNDPLVLDVIDQGGITRLHWGTADHSLYDAVREFGDAYEGVLEGYRVRVSIDPGAAEGLIIGGLPPSRLPLLAGLFALSLALVTVAVQQLRRERMLQNMRSEFVASASHELRTPLAQIRIYADTLLLDRVRSADERQRSLAIIAREATRLSHLVENMLQFSRPDGSEAPALPESLPLAVRVRESIDRFEPLAAVSGVRIVARLDPSVAAAIDPDALQQVLLNLLDNAVKYGPKNQRVVVGVEADASEARVYVEDEGPGVPPAERQRVFERFVRLERDRQSVKTGTGVGLAVVRDIVSGHGGRSFIESTSAGGSRFVVALPLQAESPA